MRQTSTVWVLIVCFVFFSSRRRHTRCLSDWSSDVCSSDLIFWYQKLSQDIKTFEDSSVNWLHAYKFLEYGLAEDKLIEAAKNGFINELKRSEERRVGKECRSECWP